MRDIKYSSLRWRSKIEIFQKTLILILFFVFISVNNVSALQSHGPPEGICVHQLTHLLFGSSVLFLLVFLKIRPMGHGKAWRYFKFSLLFFLLWNIDAFITHWAASYIPEDAIIGGGSVLKTHFRNPVGFIKIAYYIGKFDHLLCVPAMFFLTLALRTFYQEALFSNKRP